MNSANRIQIPLSGPVDGRIRIPGSKSIANRAILIASLTDGTSRLEGMLYSDDTRFMIEAWQRLGAQIKRQGDVLVVSGCGGRLNTCDEPIYIENAGTAARFLTAILTLGQGRYLLDGNLRMHQRPIGDLLEALNALGADVRSIRNNGCPPVEINASGLSGGMVEIPGEKSSQYVSAVMMAAPYAQSETRILIKGSLVSKTYVELTGELMAEFGVHCDWPSEETIRIKPGQQYQARSYWIEGDASTASYFFGLAAVTKGCMRVDGLKKDSHQGDLRLLQVLEQMGCAVEWDDRGVTIVGQPLTAVDVDMKTMSDVAPTLAVIALFAEGTTRIRNVGNMRLKECDRIRALTSELRKLGATVAESESAISVTGGSAFRGADLETWDDHRMAMSLSLAGVKIPGVGILNPACVSKTFPEYFDVFLPLIRPLYSR